MRIPVSTLVLSVLVTLVSVREGAAESYRAVAEGTGVNSGKSLGLGISIDRYTSDSELGDLLFMLREEGQEAVRAKLSEMNLGRVAPEGEDATSICVARTFELNDEKVIRLLTTRPLLETYRAGTHPDYPFTIIEIRLNQSGRGEGSVQGGMKVQFENGLLQFESSGNRYAALTEVRAGR